MFTFKEFDSVMITFNQINKIKTPEHDSVYLNDAQHFIHFIFKVFLLFSNELKWLFIFFLIKLNKVFLWILWFDNLIILQRYMVNFWLIGWVLRVLFSAWLKHLSLLSYLLHIPDSQTQRIKSIKLPNILYL